MKKIMLLLCVLLLCAATRANAADLYVDNLKILPGETMTVGLKLNNELPSKGFQLNVSLPEGLTFVSKNVTATMTKKTTAPRPTPTLGCFRTQVSPQLLRQLRSRRLCLPRQPSTACSLPLSALRVSPLMPTSRSSLSSLRMPSHSSTTK